MFELNKEAYQQVLPIFTNTDHSVPIVFSVIEGQAPGKIYVDDINHPSTALLFPKDSFFYLAGDERNDVFNGEVYDLIFKDILTKSEDKELVLFSYSEVWRNQLDNLLKEKGAIRIQRKTFSLDKEMFQRQKKEQLEVSSGYSLEQINRDRGQKIGVLKSWGTIEDFLEKGFGYCIIKDSEIVSACYSIYTGKEEVEIDIFTEEKLQGQGLGKAVATAFIDHCLIKGLTPVWSCWPFREGSIKLAKKLGFKEKEDIEAHYWSPNM